MAAQLEEDVVKFKPLFDIRWLSLGEAVNALLRNYQTLMGVIADEVRYGDPTAIGLDKQLSSYKICGVLHLVADILEQTNRLSLVFQRRDVCFSVIKNQVSLGFM